MLERTVDRRKDLISNNENLISLKSNLRKDLKKFNKSLFAEKYNNYPDW